MDETVEITRGPALGESAPYFETDIAGSRISLHDFKGRWIIIFSDPDDLLPVFKTRTINYVLCKRRTKAIALGRGTEDAPPPGKNPVKKYILRHNLTVVDDSAGDIAEAYGLPPLAGRQERGVFIVDPKGILRAKLYQPLTRERNFYDMLKLIDALQMTDCQKTGSSEKGGWRKRLDIVIRSKTTAGEGSAG